MAASRNTGGSKGSSARTFVIVFIIAAAVLLVIAIGAYLLFFKWRRSNDTAESSRPGFNLPVKPIPYVVPFRGCPPEGDGGDPILNKLKNRIDEGSYVPMQFSEVEGIKWPDGIERQHRSSWTLSQTNEVERYEGTPISVEGYLVDAKEEGPESPNCHGTEREFRDFHLWLTGDIDADRSTSLVVEMTPAVRAKHPEWRTSRLKQIAREKERVRVSGWLMLDPEHGDQVGKTRGTLWEIHPIMNFEVEQQGNWIAMDNLP